MSLVANFDLLNDGDLNGQDSWSGHTSFDVQGTTTYAGAKAVKSATATTGQEISKGFTSQTAGNQQFYVRTSDLTKSVAVDVMEGSNPCIDLRFYLGNIQYLSSLSVWTTFAGSTGLLVDTWYGVETQWAADKTARYRWNTNGGAWSDWTSYIAPGTAWTTTLDTIKLSTNNNSASAYWDEFSDPNVVGTTSSSSSSSSSSTISSSTISVSQSSSSSSSSSTSSSLTILGPGACWGENAPAANEVKISWNTWSNGSGGVIKVTGDADWGKAKFYKTEIGHSSVVDTKSTNDKTIIVTTDTYEAGAGTKTIYIRGQATQFSRDAADPAWEQYTAPISKTWRWMQAKVVAG